MEEVRARFLSTNPGKVTAAASAYTAASGELAGMRQELNDTIKYLTARWKGPAASEAFEALRKLAATAEELSSKTGQTGRVLQQYGGKILPWYKSHLPGDGFIKTGSDDEYAQKLMARFNGRIGQAYDSMPPEAQVDLPNISGGRSPNSAAVSLGTGQGAGGTSSLPPGPSSLLPGRGEGDGQRETIGGSGLGPSLPGPRWQ